MARSSHARSKKRSMKRNKKATAFKQANRKSGHRSSRLSHRRRKFNSGSRINRRRSKKQFRSQRGGFLGLGSLKQGISNLYRKVIGNKEESARDLAALESPMQSESVQQYPLNNDSVMGNDFRPADLYDDHRPLPSSMKSPYNMQTGQGYYYY
ncbi:MAG: hypothetical protein EOP45_21490 [Sphingobacteriaceae bacterium]|nr:MAG: hypothetical protein EOP45_21490 [Sphingobacteriaceae bacterium]